MLLKPWVLTRKALVLCGEGKQAPHTKKGPTTRGAFYAPKGSVSCCYPMLLKSSWYFFNKAQSNRRFDTFCYPMRRRETKGIKSSI